MPPTRTSRPSRRASPSSCSGFKKQPERAMVEARQARAMQTRRRHIGRGSLSLDLEPSPARVVAEARERAQPQAGHSRTRQRAISGLLEDLAQAPQGALVLALDPAAP